MYADLKLRASIEDLCGVAAQFAVMKEGLVDELRTALDRRPLRDGAGQPPLLGYELLAHLLKHDFVDHIVSFNFDEMMDEAIEHELGAGEYVRVTSEHQPDSVAQAADLPYLIKLHGSLSASATMKFTGTDTAALGRSMIDLLDRVLLGRRVDGDKSVWPKWKLCLVSLGYSWNDPDFANWVVARADRIAHLVVVNQSGDPPARLGSFISSHARPVPEHHPHLRVLAAPEIFSGKHREVDVGIDHLLWALWQGIEQTLTDQGEPVMPAARHLLLGYLFGPNPSSDDSLQAKNTIHNRCHAELLLHIAKTKGMVNASVMAQDGRIHRYFRLLPGGARADRNMRLKMLSKVQLVGSVYPDVVETYFSTHRHKADLAQAFAKAFQRGPMVEPTCIRSVTRPLVPPNSSDHPALPGTSDASDTSSRRWSIRWQPQDGDRFIVREVLRIFAAPEVEVSRHEDPRAVWHFRDAKPISTFRDLQYRTASLLQEEWKHLFVIAESGAWLASPAVRKRLLDGPPRTIFLIQALPADEWHLRHEIDIELGQYWKELSNRGINVFHGKLNWWQHNRHVTLSMNATHLLRGIHFRRSLKASKISPVECSAAVDLGELLLTFMSYARRVADEAHDGSRAFVTAVLEVAPAIVLSGSDQRKRFRRIVDILRAAYSSDPHEASTANVNS